MLVSYFNTAGGKVAAFEVISLYGVIHPLSITIICRRTRGMFIHSIIVQCFCVHNLLLLVLADSIFL